MYRSPWLSSTGAPLSWQLLGHSDLLDLCQRNMILYTEELPCQLQIGWKRNEGFLLVER